MDLHKMKRVHCNLCNRDSAYEGTVLVQTLAGVPKYVTVKRCSGCDTVKCPNPSCATRTLAVNLKTCPTCGTNLTPKG